MIHIINMYKQTFDRTNPNHVYCGRGSVLGNPFKMQTAADRDTVCDSYERYLMGQVVIGNPGIIAELHRIARLTETGDVSLVCFCAPKRCHCETIKRHVETILENYAAESKQSLKDHYKCCE